MAKTDNQHTDSETISSASEEFVFRPRARIMRTLGKELISSDTVALIELVKNAFDADATKVLIRFIEPLEVDKGAIEVIDNGHGMSMDIVKTAWMEPATNDKRTRTRSESSMRRLLGEKGIGRFACSRLARELELVTRRRSEPQEVYAFFDWGQFDSEDKYLDEIEILAEQREPKEICPDGTIKTLWAYGSDKKTEKKVMMQGTILRMSRLTKAWTRDDFAALQRDLSRLVSPFQKYSDFSIRLDLPPEFYEFSEEIRSPEIIKYPHYSLKGKVSKDGIYYFTLRAYATGLTKEYAGQFLWGVNKNEPALLMLTTDKVEKIEKDTPQNELEQRYIHTGPFEVELRVWDRDELGNVVQKTISTVEDVRRDLNAVAGINIYRDGFRVLPYGEPDNDWLRLDLRRVQKPTWRLSNNQIVGFVSISSDSNPLLKDQSNREGLDENQALIDLRAIMLDLLNEIEVIRHTLRHGKTQQPFSKPIRGLFTSLDLNQLRDQLVAKYPDDKDIQQLIDEANKSIAAQVDEIQVVIGRYQRLATLGTLVDVVLHDGRHPLASIIEQAILGQEDIDKTKTINRPFLNNLHQRFGKIETQGDYLNKTFDKVEPFSGRRRGRPTQLYLENIIEDTVSIFQSDIKRMGIDISLPQSSTLVRVDRAEIQQVILNLLQNSLYWLEHVEKSRRKILITVKRVAVDQVEIIFADSGPGVPPEYRDMIFEPYFSTKPNGVGLGLTIAGEIVSDYYSGKLELLDSGPLEGAVFRVTLRKRG